MRSQLFEDFDAFAESVVDVDSRMMLRNPSKRFWRTTSVKLGSVDVQLGELGSGNIAQGEMSSAGYMCYLPLTSGVQYLANGVQLNQGMFAVLEPGSEFCITTKVEHDWCVAFVPKRFVDGPDQDHAPASGSCRATRPDPQMAHEFRAFVDDVLRAAIQCPDFESSPAARMAAEEAKRLVARCVQRSRPEEHQTTGRPRIVREEIIRCTRDAIERGGNTPISVADLAAAADVSERTLRTAFTEYYGVGPSAYLQLRRLHQIRRALLAADSDGTTVSQILIDHGEWAFSRFASRYRDLYGELPSKTLRHSPRR